ncbi:hypothetical protein D3C73_1204710 [compost metagenome]
MMRIAITAPREFVEKNEMNVVRDERLCKEPSGSKHEQLEVYWKRFHSAYQRLVPLAEQYNIQLLLELKKVAFNGCANQGHVPDLAGDDRNHIKGLLYAAVE